VIFIRMHQSQGGVVLKIHGLFREKKWLSGGDAKEYRGGLGFPINEGTCCEEGGPWQAMSKAAKRS